MNKNILIVEDDLSLGFLLMESLKEAGYKVTLSRDGAAGWQHYVRENFDLCILDIMMPEMDGYTLAQKMKEHIKETPFLFLTAKHLKSDKLKGFELGAEDFITKPFEAEELLCRIKVILRRKFSSLEQKRPITQFQIGDYSFDYTRQELTYQGIPRRITQKENEVLRLLCLHRNQILRREDAVEQIYGEKDYFLGRSFDVFISRLRKLLSKDPRIKIENVFKVGFIFQIKE